MASLICAQGTNVVIMFCLTLTVTKNTADDHAHHLVNRLIDSMSDHPTAAGEGVAGFKAVGQRQVRGWFSSADEAVGFVLSAARSGSWGVHLSIVPDGETSQLDWPEDLEMPPGVSAHHLGSFDASKAPGGVKIVLLHADSLVEAKTSSALAPVEASLQLLCSIERRRSDEGQEAGLMINSGYSQTATAEQLGVSQQAVSSRLQSGYWYESRRVAFWLAEQLRELLES